MKNIELSKNLLSQLASLGVEEFVICAGARNSPLVMALAHVDELVQYSFFEERSAAFFALGRSRDSQGPVAIVTTSGTAVAELLPALVEAYYSNNRLIVITADRPSRYRFSGAPQTINQEKIFGVYADYLEIEETPKAISLARNSLHLNVCFDEPLIDSELKKWQIDSKPKDFGDRESLQSIHSQARNKNLDNLSEALVKLFEKSRQPLAIVSGIESNMDADFVSQFLKRLGIAVYAEGTSGIAHHTDFLSIRGGEMALSSALKKSKIDSVIRIGGVPTARLWRDLEKNSSIPVVHISNHNFLGLTRGELFEIDFAGLLQLEIERNFDLSFWNRQNELVREARDKLFELYSESEAAWIHRISKCILPEDLCYIGNSLPIREWDLAADINAKRHVRANRGANGIDGQLSTFYGLARNQKTSWGVFGDLTTLYDLSAPWAIKYLNGKTRTVIINNGGGKIFERVFKHSLFENTHQIQFSNWAQMWNQSYLRLHIAEQAEKLMRNLESDHSIIEIVPDTEQTKDFWQEWEQFWLNRS